MGLASVIHNTFQVPVKFNPVRVAPISAQAQALKWTRLQFLPSFSVTHRFRDKYYSIASSKGAGQESDLSTSESESSSSWTHDEAPRSVDKLGEETQEHVNYTTSIKTVALCVCTAVAFGIGIGLKDGVGKASEFFAGYILEQSLSVDNLFVFVLIFKYFKVPLMYQLFSSEEDDTDLSNNFIVKTCQRYIPVTSTYDGNRFITNQGGVWKATPLLLTVAVIELSDIAFAVDSIPAVFGVTRDPFIVFTSNLFAILGLRSLYTLISESMAELEYLQPSIAVVLGFIGCKMILDFFGVHLSTEVSLGFVATSLSAGVLLSLLKKSKL
ncbi:thylakoid membrane protein TERC, chloroplastic isoform X3 [Manihot esculenta]|uniref:thylakoid membrane protein TERC, chloroplastic isoform X3 n=1 Tax=Manihot esculenta TaxID=3983 RepID=UPI001CC5B511|nr:thylakoid membrane protein TERC, chloroplastic isoform X3 [Manihot esculenta]